MSTDWTIEHPYNESFLLDGWAKNDLIYVWKEGNPVQLAGNLSLPGGFKLRAFGSRCFDVKTTTGKITNK